MIQSELLPIEIAAPIARADHRADAAIIEQLLSVVFVDDVRLAVAPPNQWTVVGHANADLDSVALSEVFPEVWSAVDPTTRVAVLDLRSAARVIRGGAYPYLATGIVEALESAGQRPTLVILYPGPIPPPTDLMVEALDALVQSGSVILVSTTGEILRRGGRSTSDSILKALRPTERDIRSSRKRLPRRLVRKRGYFAHQPIEGEGIFRRYHYDGSLLGRELEKLIAAQMVDFADTHGLYHPAVFYLGDEDAPDWTGDPLVGAAMNAGWDVYTADEDMSSVEWKVIDGVVLWTQFVSSGATLAKARESIAKYVDATVPIACCSVLANKGLVGDQVEAVRYGTWFTSTRAGTVLALSFVEQAEVPVNDSPVYFGGAAIADPWSERSPGIPTAEYWEMVREAGVRKTEVDEPTNRKGLTFLPRFEAMVRHDGSWIVDKITASLPIGFGFEDLVFLVPRDEQGSRALAIALWGARDASVISIPRGVLDDARRSQNDLDLSAHADKPWYRRLQSAATMSQFVAVDDFSKSRGTLLAMDQVLRTFGKFLLSSCVLTDFDPDSDVETPFPVESLYSFPWG